MVYFASICAIARDEDKDIKEWLDYHLMIGFEHFLIFDNNSLIPLKQTLKEFIAAGLVTVEDFPMRNAQQLSAYMSALKYWGSNTRWLAFIDIDEFIVPMQKTNICDFLDSYNQYAGIGANWAMFGANGHIHRPAGGIIENYTSCLGLNPHIKSILQPSLTNLAKSAHHFTYKSGYFCVNEDSIPIKSFCSYPIGEKIRINHYYYKSRDDFKEKIRRGLATQMKNGKQRSMHDFYSHLDKPTFPDRQILRFQDKMKFFAELSPAEIREIAFNSNFSNQEANPAQEFAKIMAKSDLASARGPSEIAASPHPHARLEDQESEIAFNFLEDPRLAEIRACLLEPELPDDEAVTAYLELAELYSLHDMAENAKSVRFWLEHPLLTQPVG